MIDTQILLWWLSEPEKIKDKHQRIIEDSNFQIEVSICSLFEITIKRSIRKLKFDYDIKKVLPAHGFTLLNINYEHLDLYNDLPHHHKDPFDRMIIAQAKGEKLALISYDKVFSLYDISLL